jgi:hypothetical protein
MIIIIYEFLSAKTKVHDSISTKDRNSTSEGVEKIMRYNDGIAYLIHRKETQTVTFRVPLTSLTL